MAEHTQPPRPDTTDALCLTVWGARGSTPTPGYGTLRYGGETTCLEITAGGRTMIVDCGSGVRACGWSLAERGVDTVDVVFTHTHMDHVCGLPFFCCAYDPRVAVNLWGGHVPPGDSFIKIIERIMSPPIFPVATSALANTRFHQFAAGETLTLSSGLTVATVRLNHPGNACGYRVDYRGSSIAIITDHEQSVPEMDDAIAAFVDGATLMIHDAMYLDSEYPRFVGWGHSTPTMVLNMAKRARVAHPMLWHHDPCRTDDALDAMAADAMRQNPKCLVASEGDRFSLVNGELFRTASAAPASRRPA